MINPAIAWSEMRRRYKLIICALMLGAAAVRAEDCARLQEFDEIAQTVTERFYDRTFRGLDWSSTVARYRSSVACDFKERELAAVLNSLLAELKASHTAVYTQDQLDYWALQSIFAFDLEKYQVPFVGIWPVQVAGEWVAKYVLDHSPAAEAGVSPGDKLIRLDGRPFEPLGFKTDADSILVFSPAPGVERAVRIRAINQSVSAALLEATRKSERVIRVGTRSVGYVHLWSGTHPLFLESLDAALDRFAARGVDAILLDLRGGFGGASLEYIEYLQSDPRLERVRKYALIDDGVRSGKEWVAGTLKNERSATLVGSRTAGAFLAASPFGFADDKYLLYLAVSSFDAPGIGPIEGIGVEPDVPVAPCRSYCAGRDPQLEAALKLIDES
ncbi:MAG TPA: S41 family peptidase [Steroidobacteraceae bacterium]